MLEHVNIAGKIVVSYVVYVIEYIFYSPFGYLKINKELEQNKKIITWDS